MSVFFKKGETGVRSTVEIQSEISHVSKRPTRLSYADPPTQQIPPRSQQYSPSTSKYKGI